MKVFTDKHGNEHQIRLNVGVVQDVRDALNIDLTRPEHGDPPLVAQLVDDDLLLCDVLAQVIPGGHELVRQMDADDVLKAGEAFVREWIDFFRLRGRKDRVAMIERVLRVLVQVIQEVSEAMHGLPSTDSPDRLESIPDPSPPES